MVEKKKITKVRKTTKKEELTYILNGAKEEIVNMAREAVVGVKKEIKKDIVWEFQKIVKNTEKRLNKKVENINEKLEVSLKEMEQQEDLEDSENPVINEGFIPIESPPVEVIEDNDCIGRLISRENYPITVRYDGGKIVISPREIKKGILKNLIEEKIPKGITFIKNF